MIVVEYDGLVPPEVQIVHDEANLSSILRCDGSELRVGGALLSMNDVSVVLS